MKTVHAYLVVKADRRMRVVQRLPELGVDEVAFRLVVQFPDGWGKVVGQLDVAVPDFASVAAGGAVSAPERAT